MKTKKNHHTLAFEEVLQSKHEKEIIHKGIQIFIFFLS